MIEALQITPFKTLTGDSLLEALHCIHDMELLMMETIKEDKEFRSYNLVLPIRTK